MAVLVHFTIKSPLKEKYEMILALKYLVPKEMVVDIKLTRSGCEGVIRSDAQWPVIIVFQNFYRQNKCNFAEIFL
jgi:hypothetical protein